jgi:chromosomal replication initiation ATPase DnaA
VQPSLPLQGSTNTSRPNVSAEPCTVCAGEGYVLRDGKMHACICAVERRIAARLPKRYHLAKLADFSPKTTEAITAWLAQPSEGLLITGLPGTGKTHLAAAIVRRVIESCRSSLLFERCAEFYLRVRGSYREELGSEATELSRLEAPDLLVLDDLGAGSLSDFERRCTLEVLDRRINRTRPTVVTSNWTLGKIAEAMDDRIASRLAPFQLFALDGPDRRVLAHSKNPLEATAASR